ncbi:hypothetical protein GIB67_002226 [Kingdonia uniflora]|uniref:RBR-type E3 ubiquitin transferase n=1 Tax=Kingdonia uniflora TaxID=39325 RepID=A0A7J7KWR1_9MAGN|nr:hypothetical protein GIB67_002226 [Kingdonia uniflora]
MASDFEYAFELQIQEAMNQSLVLHKTSTDDDLKTLELLEKLTIEWDIEEAQTQMQNLNHSVSDNNLGRGIDEKKAGFGRGIYRVSRDYWRRQGNKLRRLFGESSNSGGVGEEDVKVKPFRLYCKGLYSDERVGNGSRVVRIAAIGTAVCDSGDNLILKVKKPLLGDWVSGWAPEDLILKVELEALIDGLTMALSYGVKGIDIFCDHLFIHQFITKKWTPDSQRIVTVVNQACLLQSKFESCRSFLVARNDVKFAFKLARDVIDSQMMKSAESSNARSLKETCTICLEDIDAGQMLVVDSCGHRYCVSCMKQHVEVKLLHGMVAKCPHEGCNTELNLERFKKLLSPQLVEMMSQQMKEALIPVDKRFYCPYPSCSALMSKHGIPVCTKDSSLGTKQSKTRECIKCRGLFCIDCCVPWHNNVSCDDYKKLNPYPHAHDAKLKSLAAENKWRQCVKCKNMIELAAGCYHITCRNYYLINFSLQTMVIRVRDLSPLARVIPGAWENPTKPHARCGNEFCYTCGAHWKNKKATCSCLIWDERNIITQRR